MTHAKHRRFGLSSRAWVFALIGFLILSLSGCESIFGPKSDEDDDDDDDEIARIVIYNQYGETLDIYMDGVYQLSVAHDDDAKIRDVSLDEHDLEAKVPATGVVVDSESIDVTAYTDYSWTIDDAPDINVTNNYGSSLKIYMDGTYAFDLSDEEDRWIMNVAFGSRFLKAARVSDGKEVASTTISVSANKDYSWTIE
jgi:hypothetical protein